MRYRASRMPPTATSSRHEDTPTANVGNGPQAAAGRGPSAEGRSRAALLIVPAAALVAGALLALRLHFQPPTVPVYALARPEDRVELVRGGRFELEAHPQSPVTGAVGARGFLLRGTEVRPWDPPFQVARDGSVRIAGDVDTLFAGVPAGSWEVAIAIGRPETLPTAPNDILRALSAEDDRAAAWRLVHERVDRLP